MKVRSLVAGMATALLAVVCVTGAAARSAKQADVATAAAAIAAYANVPTFAAPGPAFDAAKAKGKSVVIIPASSNGVADLASMSAYTGGIHQAGLAAGVKVTTCSNNGTVKAQTTCLNKAVASKASAIVLAGSLDLVGLKTPLAAAKAAGIPVIGGHVLAPGDFASGVDATYQQALAGLTATVPAPYAKAAKLEADYVTANSTGNQTILLVGASDMPESAPMLAAVQSEFSNVCTTCTVSSIDVPFSTWQTAAYKAVATATLAKTTQWLLPMFDQFDDLAAEGESDARDAVSTVNRPNICSYGGAPFAIQMGQAANRVQCDIAENMNWDGWATMDQTLRVLTGTAPVASENLPLRLWSLATNNWFTEGVGLAGETFPPTIDAGWGDPNQWINGYRTLWGLSTVGSGS